MVNCLCPFLTDVLNNVNCVLNKNEKIKKESRIILLSVFWENTIWHKHVLFVWERLLFLFVVGNVFLDLFLKPTFSVFLMFSKPVFNHVF